MAPHVCHTATPDTRPSVPARPGRPRRLGRHLGAWLLLKLALLLWIWWAFFRGQAPAVDASGIAEHLLPTAPRSGVRP